ncbi:chondroitinase-B domain-containing protein [Agarilytica rhodophyticola]|uniref:chondroitinase-B domain-containing protein n=1 Tax=Agarilytica rhodophyticola TaxID=1737490 RepID=UPI000B3442DF|nr:chondroitinase-B domain-containing protein [Agarilytica rhodophyticola]
MNMLTKKRLIKRCFLAPISFPVFLTLLFFSATTHGISVSASSHDGNIPANTLDNDLSTRWSAFGDGESITYDLMSVKNVDSLDIAFYRGNVRRTRIDVEASSDNNNWQNIWSGDQPELSLDLQKIDVTNITARYIRIVGHGNDAGSLWNSLTEVKINEVPATQNTIQVTASSDDGNSPTNTLDNDLNTRWSALGDGQWIRYELPTPTIIDSVDIAFYRGDRRRTNIDIQVSASGNTWQTLWSGDQPLKILALQNFNLNNTEAKFVRIVGHGNDGGSLWNSLTEVRINTLSGTPPSPTTTPVPTPTPTSTPSPTAMPTPTVTPTPSPTAAPTSTPSPTPAPSTTPLPPSVLNTVPDINCTLTVSNASQLESNTDSSISPGTTICITDGIYKDIELTIEGNGTENQAVTVAAVNPGKVFFEGDSQVRMSGSYVVFQGITFRNGNSSSSDLFQTRGRGGAVCNHCRITEITVIDWDQQFQGSNRWFLIYGQHNRIDHSWFSGKANRGALLTVDRGVVDPDYAQIDHNYFGNRPPVDGKEFPDTSDNEFEAVRMGTSGTHQAAAYSRVEYNYFEKIRGEAEIISNKSSFNVISHNTVRNSYGSIVSRHGSDAEISHNFIFADGYPFTGGIRLTDANHRVFNNYIEGCSFEASNFNGGIVLTDSDGSSDSGYQQVDNIFIAHNTIVDCINSINFAGGKSRASRHPTNITMINNIVAKAKGPVFINVDEGIPKGSKFAGNFISGDSFSDGNLSSLTGFTFIDPQLLRASDGLYRPQSTSPVLSGGSNDFGSFPFIGVDMDGQTRRATNPDAGADEVSSDTIRKRPLTSRDVGPINYRP